MKLSGKVIKIVVFTYIACLLFIYILAKSILLKDFNDIEISDMGKNTDRVISLINNNLDSLDSLNLEYSKWDETYDFMNSKNKEFIHSNFDDLASFKRMNIDFFMFVDNNKNVIYSSEVNKACEFVPDFNNNIQENIISKVYSTDNMRESTGVIYVNDSPLLISMNPIMRNSGRKPYNGYFIIGKYLCDYEKQSMSNKLKLNIEVLKYNKDILSKNVVKQLDDTFIEVDSDEIFSYTVLNSLRGGPGAIVKISAYRHIYLSAVKSINYFMFLLMSLGIIFVVILTNLLNETVVRRVVGIKEDIDKVYETNDLSLRIKPEGNDEISELSHRLNYLFDSLNESYIKIKELAYYDPLTKLPNRKKILDEVNKLIKSNKCNFAVFFIDLDNFKDINDSLGHDVGDFVLEKVTHRLKSIIDDNVIIGRLGGDEFLVIQKENDGEDGSVSLAEDICKTLRNPIEYNNNSLHVDASIGISFYPRDGKDMTTLIKNADTAMYAAKRKSEHSYEFYESHMNDKAVKDLILENNLRNALHNDEFVMHFQPIHSIHENKIVSSEALIRWDFQGQLIYPGHFIESAKRIGEIVNMDNWMLLNACIQCKKWHDEGYKHMSISVNSSFNNLKQPNFVEYVKEVLNTSGLDPIYLNLEITEDESMQDVELTLKVLSELKKLGVKISLDDFGTGYSSLSYVNKLPISTIKIDRSLITSLERGNKNFEIVKTIIIMAHNLDMKVISEGIETEEQYLILKELYCDFIQGYWIGRPMDISKFNDFIE